MRVVSDYSADYLDQVLGHEAASAPVLTLAAEQTVESVRARIDSHAPGSRHQGYPVLDRDGRLIGVVTLRNLRDPSHAGARPLCEAADHMVEHDIDRLPVVARDDVQRPIAMLTRSDLLRAHEQRLRSTKHAAASFPLPSLLGRHA